MRRDNPEGVTFNGARDYECKGQFTLWWRSPPVMKSKGFLKFVWPRAALLSGGALHYGQESVGEEHWTWMKK